MKKVFIDSDIIIDLFLERDAFLTSAELFNEIKRGTFSGFTTALVFANVHYVLTKYIGKTSSRQKLMVLRRSIGITLLDETIVDDALSSEGKDFEDNLQMLSAEKSGLDAIITRNKKDYAQSQLPVFSASEFLADISS